MTRERMRIEKAVVSLRQQTDFSPEIAVVLGSGLARFADTIEVQSRVPYTAVEGFPVTSVEGHAGQLVCGIVGEKRVAIFQGRCHLYEGFSAQDVVCHVRTAAAWGAHTVFLTNAAGGINPAFVAGDLMCITDHINLQGISCLEGENEAAWGPRFPDMSAVYAPDLRAHIDACATVCDVPLQHGVYAGGRGPAYETPAEVRMLKTLGADAVGMSTVQEAVAARHCGMRVAGISLISNLAAGISPTPLSHEEVTAMGAQAADSFCALLYEVCTRCPPAHNRQEEGGA